MQHGPVPTLHLTAQNKTQQPSLKSKLPFGHGVLLGGGFWLKGTGPPRWSVTKVFFHCSVCPDSRAAEECGQMAQRHRDRLRQSWECPLGLAGVDFWLVISHSMPFCEMAPALSGNSLQNSCISGGRRGRVTFGTTTRESRESDESWTLTRSLCPTLSQGWPPPL